MTGCIDRRTAPAVILVVTLALPAGARADAPGGEATGRAGRIVLQLVPIPSADRHGVATRLAAVPVLASTGAPLLGADLYRALGRADLEAEYRARQARHTTLAAAGGGLLLGGLLYAATRPGPSVDLPAEQFRAAMDEQSRAQVRGLVVSLGGGALLALAALLDPDPVDEAGRLRLIEAHDRALDGAGGPAADLAPALSLGAGPLPGGAMARVGLAF